MSSDRPPPYNPGCVISGRHSRAVVYPELPGRRETPEQPPQYRPVAAPRSSATLRSSVHHSHTVPAAGPSTSHVSNFQSEALTLSSSATVGPPKPERQCHSVPHRSAARSRPRSAFIPENFRAREAGETAPASCPQPSSPNDYPEPRLRGNSTIGRAPHRRKYQFDSIGRERGKRIGVETSDAPAPPPRRLPGEPLESPIKCLLRFNVCGDGDECLGGLHTLSSVDVSDCRSILVTDSHTMDVHTFNGHGLRLYRPFKVLGIHGGCFWTEDQLVLATHRGLRLCSADGSFLAEFPIGPVVGAKRYQLGYIAIQRTRLSIYNGIGKNVRESSAIVKTRSPGLLRRTRKFIEIADVAINSRRQIVVLNVGRDAIYVINEKGVKQMKIVPQRQAAGSLRLATAIAVDRRDNILVSDSGNQCLVHFGPCGVFRSCVLNFRVQVGGVFVGGVPSVYGISATTSGHFAIAVSGDGLAELRIYSL